VKTEKIIMRVSENEKQFVRKAAKELGQSITKYVMTKACACGESGYEGIFKSVTWACPKCKKINTWKAK